MYIRFWSSTDGGPGSATSLAYLRVLLRWAPVRLVSMSGVLQGEWRVFTPLVMTPMTGPMINVVCARPDQWVQTITVAMPKADTLHASIAAGEAVPVKTDAETITRELYTESAKKNVLIALDAPASPVQQLAAMKYPDVIVPSADIATRFGPMNEYRYTAIVPVPIPSDSAQTLRAIVLGR